MDGSDSGVASPCARVYVRPSVLSRAAVLAAITAIEHGMTEAEAETVALFIRPHDLLLALTIDGSATRTVAGESRPLRFCVSVPTLPSDTAAMEQTDAHPPSYAERSLGDGISWGGWIRHRDLVESLRSRVKNSEDYGVLSDDHPAIIEVFSGGTRKRSDRMYVHARGYGATEPRQITVL